MYTVEPDEERERENKEDESAMVRVRRSGGQGVGGSGGQQSVLRARRLRTKGILIVVAVCATSLECSFHRVVSMPEDLIGVWKTPDKKYADRYFELEKDQVVFSTGGRGVTAHPIDRIEEYSENGKIQFIIYYPNDEGDEYQFSFYYDPTYRVIRFKNQEQFEWGKWVEGALGPSRINR